MDTTFPERDAFALAAASVLDLAGSPEVARAWEAPSALEGMTVGGLAGHLVVAVEMTLTLMDRPVPPDAEVADPYAFFGDNRLEGPAAADERARRIVAGAEDMGAAGQRDVLSRLTEAVAAVERATAGADPDRLVATNRLPDAGARLADYLATRVVELVVHGDDLAVSVGVVWNPPAAAAYVACRLLLDLARGRVGDLDGDPGPGPGRARRPGGAAGPVRPQAGGPWTGTSTRWGPQVWNWSVTTTFSPVVSGWTSPVSSRW